MHWHKYGKWTDAKSEQSVYSNRSIAVQKKWCSVCNKIKVRVIWR